MQFQRLQLLTQIYRLWEMSKVFRLVAGKSRVLLHFRQLAEFRTDECQGAPFRHLWSGL